ARSGRQQHRSRASQRVPRGLAPVLAADAEGVPVRMTEVELPDPPRLVLRFPRDLVAELTGPGVGGVELRAARQEPGHPDLPRPLALEAEEDLAAFSRV